MWARFRYLNVGKLETPGRFSILVITLCGELIYFGFLGDCVIFHISLPNEVEIMGLFSRG